MPFRFSLEEVLDYRRTLEETRRREMAEVLQQVERVEGLIEQARERHREQRAEMSELSRRGMRPADQELYLNYLQGLDMLIEKSVAYLADLRRELERRRELLRYAVNQRRVMDELRKEEHREYRLEESRAETREFDDIAVRNYLTAQREKSARERSGERP